MASAAAADTVRFSMRTGRIKMASFRKEFFAAKVQRLVSGQRLVAIASSSNLDQKATENISAELRTVGAEVSFIKNSLMRIGLTSAGLDPLAGFLHGPTCVIAGDAEIDVAKKIMALQKKSPTFVVLGAMLEGRLLIQWDQVEKVAAFESKEQVHSQLVGAIGAERIGSELVQLVSPSNVLQVPDPALGLLRVLQAHAEGKGEKSE